MKRPCPLCRGRDTQEIPSHSGRPYLQCGRCFLIFVPAGAHLSPEEERARYLTHQNHPEDEGYRSFLNRLARPLLTRLQPGQRGLDFGSGPGPTLSLILEEAGMIMKNYDPFFSPDSQVLKASYDFVTSTETWEHFRQPALEIERQTKLLKPGGILAVMTELLLPTQDFSQWYYQRDPTHIGFFQEATMKFIAEGLGWELEFPEKNVIFFIKP